MLAGGFESLHAHRAARELQHGVLAFPCAAAAHPGQSHSVAARRQANSAHRRLSSQCSCCQGGTPGLTQRPGSGRSERSVPSVSARTRVSRSRGVTVSSCLSESEAPEWVRQGNEV